jgi:asparagine synthase (glutamine-hydrolysing)
MCGIAGIWRLHGEPVVEQELHAMAAALRHRGPDDQGFHLEGSLGLAHRRLAILDLTAAGRQPMSNEDGTIWIVYNGQLYDFQPIRKELEERGHRFRSRTDTEVMLHLYEDVGDRFVDRIDGMFALALWDARQRRLLLARDRLGIKPLYVFERESSIAFASELRALLALPDMPRDIDPTGIMRFLFYSAPTGGTCLVRGVRRLDPGVCLVWEDGRRRQRRYWSLSFSSESDSPSFESAVASVQERLAAAVRSHLVADVPVGVFLSGGLDSSAVARAATEASAGALHSFSVRFVGDGAVDEGPTAKATAAALGMQHHELLIGPEVVTDLPVWMEQCDEPLATTSAIPLFHLARFAREHVKVVLTGDGADELIGGYPWRHDPELSSGRWNYRAVLRTLALMGLRSCRSARGSGPGLLGQLSIRAARFFRERDAHYASIVATFTPEELKALLAPDLHSAVDAAWTQDPVRSGYASADGADEVNRRLYAEIVSTLEGEMLTKVDRMTMISGLEARVPFLDRGLVEWIMTLPGEYKIRGGIGKRLLRSALSGDLPAVARGPKRGFSPPQASWLRGPLANLVGDTFSADNVRHRGWYQPQALQRLIGAHFDRRADQSRKVFTLLALEMWLRRVLGERVTPSSSQIPLS